FREDFQFGYHRLREHEEGIPNTVVRMRYEHFEATVMPFGLTNTPAVFMNRVDVGVAEEGEGKIEAVKNWKAPTTPSEVRSSLGLASYYRRFIENFSKIAKPPYFVDSEESEV
ncbi:hypothetical protein Tco_0253714, partial [Tanacetum coccineum]